MGIENSLRIKYGLRNTPTNRQILEWYREVLSQIVSGESEEEAGHIAAEKVFPDYWSSKYAAEADTIEALLSEIRSQEGLDDEDSN